ncbi:MAG: pentapeptide repeat-containing protein, partial [Candidatus Competibacter sp.]|nr:pentapeptide repeat-containing protein [Candidatus Competibacter sp.]
MKVRNRSAIVLLPPLCLLTLLHWPALGWGACEDPPARRVSWLRCDKQGVDLTGADLREAVLTQVNLSNAKLT